MLILKPKGRGNWRTLRMSIEGVHVSPMLVRVGHLLTLGGVVFRVCEVRP